MLCILFFRPRRRRRPRPRKSFPKATASPRINDQKITTVYDTNFQRYTAPHTEQHNDEVVTANVQRYVAPEDPLIQRYVAPVAPQSDTFPVYDIGSKNEATIQRFAAYHTENIYDSLYDRKHFISNKDQTQLLAVLKSVSLENFS